MITDRIAAKAASLVKQSSSIYSEGQYETTKHSLLQTDRERIPYYGEQHAREMKSKHAKYKIYMCTKYSFLWDVLPICVLVTTFVKH